MVASRDIPLSAALAAMSSASKVCALMLGPTSMPMGSAMFSCAKVSDEALYGRTAKAPTSMVSAIITAIVLDKFFIKCISSRPPYYR
ncbi:hypothetical protein DSECCO2_624970 [anaerobic digester metagenome]